MYASSAIFIMVPDTRKSMEVTFLVLEWLSIQKGHQVFAERSLGDEYFRLVDSRLEILPEKSG